MNFLRAVLDGLMMAVSFNALAAFLVLVNPRYFFDSYPKSIQRAAPQGMTPDEKRVNQIFTVIVLPALLVYGAVSSWQTGLKDFGSLFLAGYIHWILVNFGDFFFLDILLFQKLPDRVAIPGTEGHRDYRLGNWMKVIGLLEHLILWPFVLVPLFALLETAIAKGLLFLPG